ncbi:MAG: Holliday junction branch migration protein RuvA [Balneolaceae bacterium]|nr:Holliday junction branch migration protein RuvA [Balneolaceae bacterium]
MIAYLKGKLAEKATDYLILDVNDVGYHVEISTLTYEELPKEGTDMQLLIHHHFTDNDQRLFGFFSSDEKELFELLITVKGVGPKLGLTILSGLPAAQIIDAVIQSDKAALTQITGIGKKTAERMILELKDKMAEISTTSGTSDTGTSVSGSLKEEAISALESLGFKKRDSEKAVIAAARNNDVDDVQKLVKKSLKQLKR